MHENKFNSYRVPSGLLILFLEKALTLIHMETHLTDVGTIHFISQFINRAKIIIFPFIRTRSREYARFRFRF